MSFAVFFACLLSLGTIDEQWLNTVQNRKDPRAEEWYHKELKSRLQEIKPDRETLDLVAKSAEGLKKKCYISGSIDLDQKGHPLLVAMTFDLPDQTWVDLSYSLQKAGGAFIVRGLPNNSFSELAKRLKKLVEIGVHAQILIDPKSFENFEIQSVPTFITSDGSQYDKLTGNVSLSFALEKMALEGDSIAASQCLNRLKM